MDVIVIFNGLGNQMSQYAFYLEKKKIDRSTYLISFCKDHNGLELDRVFNVDFKNNLLEKMLYLIFRILLTDKKILKPIKYLLMKLKCRIVNENYDYSFNHKYLIPARGITYYVGGWHTEKYFSNVKKDLLSAFTFNYIPEESNTAIIKQIHSSNSIALHVRRGDYMNEANINLFGKVSTKAYFEKAIDFIQGAVQQPHYFVFSNDIEWVKQNLSLKKVTFVNHNKGIDSWRDMHLMSECKHNIISNSSFSWWGAWLNSNENKIVVSPSRFLNNDTHTDVYPSDWIKISGY